MPFANGSGYPKNISESVICIKIPSFRVSPKMLHVPLQVVDREDKKVVPSSRLPSSPAPTLPDTVADVDKANFSAAWQKNQELRGPCSEGPPACSVIPWVQEVLTQVQKLWGLEVPIIPCSSGEEATTASNGEVEELQEMPMVVPLLAVLVDQHHLVFIGQQPPASIAQLFTFSPAAIQGRQTKAHFLMFQLLQLFHRIEILGLSPGPLSLHQLHLSKSLLLQTRHSMTGTTLHVLPHLPVVDTNTKKLQDQLNAVLRKIAGEEGIETSLDKAVHLWSKRQLSNLDYLLFLNYLAGRRFGQPNHHPVVPWVTDFSSSQSVRDLTKSKFRLTKGDEALERTYEAGVSGVVAPHHVTDVLSEITYYTYLSRRTSREVLQRTVRPSWVPAEYPGSVTRLYQVLKH